MTGPDRLHGRETDLDRHRRPQPELLGPAELRDRREPVHRETGTHEVQVHGGIGQRRRRVGQVTDLERHAAGLDQSDELAEQLGLREHGRVGRLVGEGEVGPDPDDLDRTLGPGRQRGVEHVRQLRRGEPVATETGVDLEMDPRPPAGPPRGRVHRGQCPRRRDGHVDVGLEQGVERSVRTVQPGQDAGAETGCAQVERLVDLRRPEPGRATLDGGAGGRDEAVTVRVGLHDGHHLRRARVRRERTDVVSDGREVDDHARREEGHRVSLPPRAPSTRCTTTSARCAVPAITRAFRSSGPVAQARAASGALPNRT